MALQGDLDIWPITEVLRMLAATGKTGFLRVDAEERQGVVWFRDGSISAVTTDHVPDLAPLEALSDLLRFCHGSFVFGLDDRAPEVAAECPVDDMIQDAQAVLEEWDNLRAEVPSLECGVEMVEQIPGTKVTISAELWRAVAAVADGCTVSSFASRLGLTELGALRSLHELTAAGLLRIGLPQRQRGAARLA